MRIYIAGLYTSNANVGSRLYNEVMTENEKQIVFNLENKLESYHYVGKQIHVDRMRETGARVFLDSGAFSAFTLGETIDIGKYCEYIHLNKDLIDFASVLDGIGDPFKTYQNQSVMEALGTKPLPCFHYGEDERYLEHYIANYEHITLGGMVPHSTAENKLWLDRMWDKYLCDKDGHPKLKVHGFGMTSIPLMKRYPWYSVDSSSWVQMAFRGAIFIPEFGAIHISSTSPARKDEGQHFDTFTKPQQQAITDIIEARGFSPKRLAEIYISRWVFNIESFVLLQKELSSKDLRFNLDQYSIF